ncbi:hypothetical protein QUA56_17075 [Microcoleus sp. N3A4]|uniref:hypothetical protein n=1 Tax=Microcoleus sp. N3A4 TaxID=3055379 RepID=UPI002FD5073A
MSGRVQEIAIDTIPARIIAAEILHQIDRCLITLNFIIRRKREEGRRKREEGRGKKEEGRRKREEGRRKKEEGRGKKEEGRKTSQCSVGNAYLTECVPCVVC